jgi:hypothetical protein
LGCSYLGWLFTRLKLLEPATCVFFLFFVVPDSVAFLSTC